MSVRCYLIKKRITGNVQMTAWHHFHHLSIHATFQIYSPLSLCCHRHTANHTVTDALTFKCAASCSSFELWSLWSTNRVSGLGNIKSWKVWKLYHEELRVWHCHGTYYKSETNVSLCFDFIGLLILPENHPVMPLVIYKYLPVYRSDFTARDKHVSSLTCRGIVFVLNLGD